VTELGNRLPTRQNTEVIACLEQAIAGGKHWYMALLEAIGLWTAAEESYDGRSYRYLIAGEAFDWMLLAERLCQAIDGLLPEDEKISLLFHGRPPVRIPEEKFKELIGSGKYHQYLNYFYGIIVEEALISAVQAEVRKEQRLGGHSREPEAADEAYRRVYGASKDRLLKLFRRENGYPQLRSISLTEIKEFTYWLFKYRLKQCEKARVASDTKKALEWLSQQQAVTNLGSYEDLSPGL